MLYVSLGSNCSVTHQLKIRDLKYKSFPFDWCKITISQLISVLENNFKNYMETIIINKISNNHKHKNNNLENSLVLKNYYGITFAHEITNEKELGIFKDKLSHRIYNFNQIKQDEKIIFIRIELKPIKKTYQEQIIKLLDLLHKYSNNFILKLVLNSDIIFDELMVHKGVQIYNFDQFTSDWQMNNVDWDGIFRI